MNFFCLENPMALNELIQIRPLIQYVSYFLFRFLLFLFLSNWNLNIDSPHHHPDSFAKNCDICNAKASHTQGAYKTVAPHTKNSPKSFATLQVNENSVIISNNPSNLNQTTASATSTSTEQGKHVNSHWFSLLLYQFWNLIEEIPRTHTHSHSQIYLIAH